MDTADCNTALREAIYNNDLATVQHLVWSGADVDSINDNGWTPLHLACSGNHFHVIIFLLKEGADLKETQDGQIELTLLDENDSNFNECQNLILKHIVKVLAKNICLPEVYINYIFDNPTNLEIFYDCIQELEQLKVMKFFQNYSYYDILMMNQADIFELAFLLKNSDFDNDFLCKFPHSSNFSEDLWIVYYDGVNGSCNCRYIYCFLESIFYNYLPALIIRKIVHFLI